MTDATRYHGAARCRTRATSMSVVNMHVRPGAGAFLRASRPAASDDGVPARDVTI
jgi:hypothetical protein